MTKTISVSVVIAYLLGILALIAQMGYALLFGSLLPSNEYNLLVESILIAGAGGVLYCLRGVYLNYCVRKNWDSDWMVWYLIRPVASLICGGVSFLFLKAGLLVLEAKKETDATNLGFFALAFIAGLNVDKFIMKIEELAKATWGIEKSRSAGENDNH
ncbi:hypothetical protein GWC95_15610 [Sediminibacterium roseum]|uniref:Uncharacterized protein n=1 Tax=Sediminibacterium roseum TaxID=1978412 RepID=A0ABW9ZW52_9BACT|nr:hypothetical protein [Sediminibacterium roseum]NCI51355.1 hypothetical protein [Sediminibacterium roseum]